MGLNIDDPEVNRLVAEVAAATGETETEVVRRAMLDRKEQLGLPMVDERVRQIMNRMDRELLPLISPERRNNPLTPEEQNEILGYGPGGYADH